MGRRLVRCGLCMGRSYRMWRSMKSMNMSYCGGGDLRGTAWVSRNRVKCLLSSHAYLYHPCEWRRWMRGHAHQKSPFHQYKFAGHFSHNSKDHQIRHWRSDASPTMRPTQPTSDRYDCMTTIPNNFSKAPDLTALHDRHYYRPHADAIEKDLAELYRNHDLKRVFRNGLYYIGTKERIDHPYTYNFIAMVLQLTQQEVTRWPEIDAEARGILRATGLDSLQGVCLRYYINKKPAAISFTSASQLPQPSQPAHRSRSAARPILQGASRDSHGPGTTTESSNPATRRIHSSRTRRAAISQDEAPQGLMQSQWAPRVTLPALASQVDAPPQLRFVTSITRSVKRSDNLGGRAPQHTGLSHHRELPPLWDDPSPPTDPPSQISSTTSRSRSQRAERAAFDARVSAALMREDIQDVVGSRPARVSQAQPPSGP